MAVGATEFIDATTAANNIPTLYSKKVLIAREEALVFFNLVNKEFKEDLTYGSTLNVLSIGNLAVVSKNTSNNAATTYETITETNTQIVVGTWEYSAVAIEDFAKVQQNVDMMAKYAPKQGYALAESLDATLAGLPDNFTQIVGTLTVENTYDEYLRAIQYLDDANAPTEDRQWVVSPAGHIGMMKLDVYVNRDFEDLHGDKDNSKKRGYMGVFLDYPVYKSTNVEGTNAAGHDNTLFQQEAIACVLQMTPKSNTFWDIDQLASKAVTQHIYGVKEMRDDHGVWIKGA